MKKILSVALSSALVASGILAAIGTSPQKVAADPIDPSMSACPTMFSKGIIAEGAPLSVIEVGTTTTNKKPYPLNGVIHNKTGKIVYGDYNDIKKDPRYSQDYDSATGQWRYLGYSLGKNAYFNGEFPPDATATRDVSTRNWIVHPWENTPNSSHSAVQADWWERTDTKERGEWLQGIYDSYTKQVGGNWKKFPSPWYEYIDRFFVWEQAPDKNQPGTVTGWHTRASGDWYDTFTIYPQKPKSDIALDPLNLEVNEDGTEVTFTTWSNFTYRQIADMSIEFHTNRNGGGEIDEYYDPSAKIEGATTAGGTANGASVFGGKAIATGILEPAIAKTNTNAFSPLNVSRVCKDLQQMPEDVWNEVSKAVQEHDYLQVALPYTVGITGDFGETKYSVKVPEAVTELLLAGEEVYMTGIINASKNPDELYWSNNQATWRLTMDNDFKTPPIKFKDITKTSSIAWWDPLPEATVDHYELTCTNNNTKTNTGKQAEWALTGLTPATTYKCTLEAFDPGGNSGGKETGTFTTLDDDPPPVVNPPTSPGGPGGGWDEIGLIREIGNVKQQNPSATNYPKTVNEYQAIKSNTSLANNNTPYFGEKLGMYAIPTIGNSSYSWNFTYTVYVWDSCKTTDKDGKCVGGDVPESRTGTETCPVKYPMAGPPGLGSTTSNPVGRSASISTKWGKTGTATVKSAGSGQCVATDSRNPNRGQVQFTYYYPTLIEIDPSLLIDKGFNPTYNKIDDAWKDQWIQMKASSYSLGSDGRSLSGSNNDSTINFKMLWSRYGNIGTGG